MSKHSVWHEARTSSLFGGTYTAWCGVTVRKRDTQTRWFGWSNKCPACLRAKRVARR